MMNCIDELENQRRELEARRAMLEERFKLRLATAQVCCTRTATPGTQDRITSLMLSPGADHTSS